MDTPTSFTDPEAATAAAAAHNAAGEGPRVIPIISPAGVWELAPNDSLPTDYWRAIGEMMAVTLKGTGRAG